MSDVKWLKQASDKPLFEDLLWSRPENKAHAGSLLIVGGNSHAFKAPASIYAQAIKAGIGSLRVILPRSLEPIVGKSLEDAVYCPSNKSGGFARQSLAEVLDYAKKSDLTLLAGDFGHNSESSILIESFLEKHKGAVCLTGDSVDPFYISPTLLFERSDTLLVAETSVIQKLLVKARYTKPFNTSANLIQVVELLSDLTKDYKLSIVTRHQNSCLVAIDGQVSTTESKDNPDWTIKLAAYASTWWLQNQNQKFKAITTGVYSSRTTDDQ